ncbi:DUF2207 domain-containing protein [Cellulosilyticum sp. I15G10I2]|uniref:DUF2207 domain-containing protein n=1 Tax=Cellulosilyticum sp. I15G10I2 TaxID=1892843 RepID=UPI00085CBBFE|nr:DUF2207 domain-containing protein [Cellulosilyticum sp. I15G10I2]
MIRKFFLYTCLIFIGLLTLVGVIHNITGFNAISFITDKAYRYYSFDSLHYEVKMLADGDAKVVMDVSYNYKIGRFSRVTFELDGDISDLVVSENGKAFTLLGDFDSSRPENTYYYTKQGNKTQLQLYMRAEKEERTFTIAFKQKQTTVLYEDCAVYFHKFLSESNDMKIGRVSAKIKMVTGAKRDNTLIWGHGAGQGKIEFDHEDKNVLLSIKNPPKYNYVEARILMSDKLFQDCQYVQSFKMKGNVIRDETNGAKKEDKERRNRALSTILGFFASVVIMSIPLAVRLKERKLYRRITPEMMPQYYRDIPLNIPPAIMHKLFYYYDKNNHLPKAISATIVDLIQRKMIDVCYEYRGRKSEIVLTPSPKKIERAEVTGLEATLMHFMFKTVGKDNKVTVNQIRQFCKNKNNFAATSVMLKSVTSATEKLWIKYGYELNKKEEGKFSFITVFMLIGAIGAYVFIANNKSSPTTAAMVWVLVSLVIGFIISMNISKKPGRLNQMGENNLSLWQGFYNFLKDFTLFKEKDLPELFMWERYLVYATALGVAEKVLKKLKLKYPQLDDQNYLNDNNMHMFYTMSSYNTNQSYLLGDLTTSFESAVTDAQNVVSNLSQSSSNGNGGGFSSGGDSGGGGSGGFSGGSSD